MVPLFKYDTFLVISFLTITRRWNWFVIAKIRYGLTTKRELMVSHMLISLCLTHTHTHTHTHTSSFTGFLSHARTDCGHLGLTQTDTMSRVKTSGTVPTFRLCRVVWVLTHTHTRMALWLSSTHTTQTHSGLSTQTVYFLPGTFITNDYVITNLCFLAVSVLDSSKVLWDLTYFILSVT